jgi:hypothetical protein
MLHSDTVTQKNSLLSITLTNHISPLVDVSDHSACNGVHVFVVCLHVLWIIFTVEVSYFRKRSNAKNTVEVVCDPDAKFAD